MSTALTRLPEWQALLEHRRACAGLDLRAAFDADPDRFRRHSLRHAGILLDYSKSLITRDTLPLLAELARARGLKQATDGLFRGDVVNFTEGRAALHTALRAGPDARGGHAVDIRRTLDAMRRFCDDARAGRLRGSTGEPIADIVCIGIGGSHLGPALGVDALAQPLAGAPHLHFLSSIDGAAVTSLLEAVDPETTLFLVASKTFTTAETLLNATTARDWISGRLGRSAPSAHFAAVTASTRTARAFGVPEDRIFESWDWVGGRYSVWSAFGLPVALAAGMDRFEDMLAGARAMDEHFRTAPTEANLPAVMGLLGVWHSNFFGATTRAVVPYDARLKRLPDYLQQLEMESNGKRATREGGFSECATSPVVWGAPGTEAQHACFQLLHQGSHLAPVDFVACRRADHALPAHHRALLANCFAQSEALMRGKTADEALRELLADGLPEARAAALAPHRVFPGNRPSNTLLLDALTPHAFGALLALYEHKVYVESVIWGIDAFDQWGVEFGKHLAGRIESELSGAAPGGHDASTAGLIDHCNSAKDPT